MRSHYPRRLRSGWGKGDGGKSGAAGGRTPRRPPAANTVGFIRITAQLWAVSCTGRPDTDGRKPNPVRSFSPPRILKSTGHLGRTTQTDKRGINPMHGVRVVPGRGSTGVCQTRWSARARCSGQDAAAAGGAIFTVATGAAMARCRPHDQHSSSVEPRQVTSHRGHATLTGRILVRPMVVRVALTERDSKLLTDQTVRSPRAARVDGVVLRGCGSPTVMPGPSAQ